ncbi:MAG: hypothetical protein ACXWDO_03315 [Bacteroidia bacterium]
MLIPGLSTAYDGFPHIRILFPDPGKKQTQTIGKNKKPAVKLFIKKVFFPLFIKYANKNLHPKELKVQN